MFIKRLMVEGASLVCSVESTKWPVSAALTPDFRRFEVANLADQNDVGVLAEERAQRGPQSFRPICSFICTWLMPAIGTRPVFRGHDVGVDGI